MNIALAHIGVSCTQVFFSVLIGLLPWNFITVRAGLTLKHMKSLEDVNNNETRLTLLALALIMLLPPIGKYIFERFFKSQRRLSPRVRKSP